VHQFVRFAHWDAPYVAPIMQALYGRRVMDKLKSIHSKLHRATELLNEAAGELVKSEIVCQAADIRSIGEALANVMDVKMSIYETRPELKPEYLNDKQQNLNYNREFGRIIIQKDRFLAENNPHEAIALYKSFIDRNPSQEYIEMANDEVARIKKLFAI
jgi:hypothetical protein